MEMLSDASSTLATFTTKNNASSKRTALLFFVLVGVARAELERASSGQKTIADGFQRDGPSPVLGRRAADLRSGADHANLCNEAEAKIVRWIFDCYLVGDGLGKIVAGLQKQGIPSPTGKPKWNRESISKLLSNEKHTGSVLLQKTLSVCGTQFKNEESWNRF